MEEEKSGITLKDIFRTIFSQKWLALMIAVVVAVVCVFVLYFGYGPSKAEYVSSFTVNMDTDDSGKPCYPDGREFNYRQLISDANLNAVKNSDEAFKYIDVSDLGISLVEKTETDAQNKITSRIYTLRVKVSAFDTKGLAAKFIDAVARTPEKEIRTWVDKYSRDIEFNYGTKSGYERKVEYIETALNSLKDRFNKINGVSDAALVQVDNLLHQAGVLKGELYNGLYESDTAALNSAVYYLKDLKMELESVETVLSNLTALGSDGATGTTIVINGADLIVSYSERKAELAQKIKYYEEVLAPYSSGTGTYTIPESVGKKVGEEAFAGKLTALKDNVCALTTVFRNEYLEKSSVLVYVGESVTKEGATGLLTSLVVGVVVGIIVAAVVAYIVGWNKLKKQKCLQCAPSGDTANTEGENPESVNTQTESAEAESKETQSTEEQTAEHVENNAEEPVNVQADETAYTEEKKAKKRKNK